MKVIQTGLTYKMYCKRTKLEFLVKVLKPSHIYGCWMVEGEEFPVHEDWLTPLTKLERALK